MSFLAMSRSWWRAVIHRSQADCDVEDELRFHIEQRTQELVEVGLSEVEAARTTRIEMGQPTIQKENYREAIGLRPLYEISGDIKNALRSLRRHPFFSLSAILSLALGIGATSAMFNVIYSAVLNPFPYRDSERIVNPSLVDERNPQVPTWFPLEPAQFREFSKAKSIESVLGFLLQTRTETGGSYPEDVRVAYVTTNMNEFLGVPVLLGRGLQGADDTQNVAVLNYKFWKGRFGGEPSVIGRIISLDHQPVTIIGVMPERFTFTETVGDADCYIPWSASWAPALLPWIKLKQGITASEADSDFKVYLKEFQRQNPTHFPKYFHVDVQPIAKPYLSRTGRTLSLLLVSVVLLLLIGCANCSVLLLARGETSERELSIRAALGASRFRLIRQLLVESLTIAVSGTLLGVAIALWFSRIPLQLMPNLFPHEAVVTVNWPVLGCSMATGIIAGIAFGLAPALRFSRPDIVQIIQARGRSQMAAGGSSLPLLVGAQTILTCILLNAAFMAISGFRHTTSMNLGYDPHYVGFIELPLKIDSTKNRQAYAHYIEALADAVGTVPGVVSVGVSSTGIPPSQPFGDLGSPAPFEFPGEKPQETTRALIQLVNPGFFETMKIPLLRGRLWSNDENRRGDFVAVVNESFVSRYMKGKGVLGDQVRSEALKNDGAPANITSPSSGEWRQIIGVVADARNDGLERPVAPAIYVPYSAFMWNNAQIFFRSNVAPTSLDRSLRLALHGMNAEQRIGGNRIETLEHVLSVQTIWVQQHMLSVLFTVFGVIALALSLFGIASSVLFLANGQKKEIGIRLALGASRGHVLWTVMQPVILIISLMVLIGLLVNLALARILGHWMQVHQSSFGGSLSVALLLLLASTLACLGPALRASRADPLQILRDV